VTPNPFSMLNQGGDREAFNLAQAIAWEDARVRHTLRRVGLVNYRKRLEKEADEETGSKRLTFERFNRKFPTFPALLGCHSFVGETPIHSRGECIHPRWFQAFMKLPFIEPYEELYDVLGDEVKLRPVVAMVFKRKRFDQGLVVHNGDVDRFVAPKSSCHLYRGGGVRKKTVNLVVQPYDNFLKYIYRDGHGWKPD